MMTTANIVKAAATLLATMLLTVSCATKTDTATPLISGSEDPTLFGKDLAQSHTPRELAAAVVDWLATAEVTNRHFAAKLTSAIAETYDDGQRELFFAAIDSVALTHPEPTRARIFAAGSIPERLAERIATDNDIENADRFATLVAEAYASDSTLHRRFKAAYKFHSRKTNQQ